MKESISFTLMTSSPIFVLFRRQTLMTESILIFGIFINTENIIRYINSRKSINIILIISTMLIKGIITGWIRLLSTSLHCFTFLVSVVGCHIFNILDS
jgi:hypothetical protein